jgi:hypothetical protein
VGWTGGGLLMLFASANNHIVRFEAIHPDGIFGAAIRTIRDNTLCALRVRHGNPAARFDIARLIPFKGFGGAGAIGVEALDGGHVRDAAPSTRSWRFL